MVEFQTLPQVPEAPVLAVKEVAGDGSWVSLTIQANDAGSSPIEAYTTTCSVLEADEEMSPPLHLLNVNTGNFEISATAPARLGLKLSDTIATQNIFQSTWGSFYSLG